MTILTICRLFCVIHNPSMSCKLNKCFEINVYNDDYTVNCMNIISKSTMLHTTLSTVFFNLFSAPSFVIPSSRVTGESIDVQFNTFNFYFYY